MNKQLIEKIALEERNALEHETKRNIAAADWDIQALVTRCLARIDAERGKEAKAWCSDGFVTTDPSKANQWLRNGHEVNPLSLSPTIPEGMALVPIEATDDMISAACDVDDSFRVDVMRHWDAMIAAAQGERK